MSLPNTSNLAHDGANAGRKRTAHELDSDETINFEPVPAYDPRMQTVPKAVTLSKEWAVFEEGKHILYKLCTGPLQKSSNPDKHNQRLLEFIKAGLFGYKTEKIIVCFSGNMNTGKSSTINSLFQVGAIAREGDDGGSCTLATHKYQAPKPDQKAPFLAEVYLFNRQQRRDIIGSYLGAYYRATHNNDEDEEGAGNCTTSDDAEADINTRNDIADAFVALFVDHPECKNTRAARRFLDEAQSEEDEAILSKLNDWADSLIRRITGNEHTVAVEASTAGDLLTKVHAFSTYTEDDEGNPAPSFWPLVSLINYHFNDPMTRLGVTILDVPGTSDTNRTRCKSAALHRKWRTHCAIVTDAARARDDPTVPKEVKLMKSRGPGSVVIVSPKSDVIGDTTIPPGSKRDKDMVHVLRERVKKLENELNANELQVSTVNEEKLCTILKKKLELEARLKYAQNAEKAHRITMRSEFNETALQEKLQDAAGTECLIPVVSISNTEYAKHLKGYAPKNAPVLTVEETNIPTLQRLICSFPNKARLNEASHLVNTQLPALISRVYLSTSKTAVERKEDMEGYVTVPLRAYEEMVGYHLKRIEKVVTAAVLVPLREGETEWVKKAGKLCDGWFRGFKTQALLGIMNRNGLRRGRGQTREVNLSADLIHLRSDKIADSFNHVVSARVQFERDLDDELENLVSAMIYDMRNDANASFVTLDPFYNVAHLQKPRLRHAVWNTAERLIEDIDAIKGKLTSENAESYLVEAMLPIYEKVRALKGGKYQTEKKPEMGWPKYRNLVFKHEITKLNGIWTTIYKEAERELQEAFRYRGDSLLDEVKKVFTETHDGFTETCEAKESNDPEETKHREELRANLKKAEEHLHGPMQKAVETMLKDFR